MRLLQFVILSLIAVCPDDVFSQRRGRRTNADKKIANGPCGKPYLRQIDGKCYYLAIKKMSWFGAHNNCLHKGLTLADLSSADEFDAVIKFLHTKGNMEDFWFGGNDLQSEGRFTYISNGRPVRYLGGLNAIEETQRSNLDDCLEIRLRQNSTTVTDENCQERQFFICQTNEVKCAQPVEEELGGVHHSHEHLHHFHHDATKAEVTEKGSEESVESDSRPADNSNSTEVGESPESDEHDEGEEIQDVEGGDIGGAKNPDEATQTGEAESTVGAVGSEGTVGSVEAKVEETTPLPTETETTTAVEEPTTPETLASPEGRAPRAITTEPAETTTLMEEAVLKGRAPVVSPVSFDMGTESITEATNPTTSSEMGTASEPNTA